MASFGVMAGPRHSSVSVVGLRAKDSFPPTPLLPASVVLRQGLAAGASRWRHNRTLDPLQNQDFRAGGSTSPIDLHQGVKLPKRRKLSRNDQGKRKEAWTGPDLL